jgi:hypothetical protein
VEVATLGGYGGGDCGGYGYGYGYGYGSVLPEMFADHPLVREYTADGSQLVLAVWRSGLDGRPVNGGRGEPVTAGLVQEVPGPLRICSSNALHASRRPSEWSGERWWVVALWEPVQWEGDKCASLKRLIVEEMV